jgi:hypothetical protein
MARRELLVEGNDDFHVMMALLAAHNVPQVFTVVNMGSDQKLLDQLPVRLKQSDLERLGVILDADEDLISRWQQLKDRLHRAGCLGIAESPAAEGIKLQIPDRPSVGVWIMPDNRLPGMLENLLAFLIPEGDDLLPHVDSFLTGIPEAKRRFSLAHWPKARLHSWLALQHEPGKPLGEAITARYLDAYVPATGPFLSWLRQVFVEDGPGGS